jgi:hypothetical protein
MTVGPIESTLHPNRGYGSAHSGEAMVTVRKLGANWVSITPFGRVWDLAPSAIDWSFEAPHHENQNAVRRTIEQAHDEGLKVMLVPHLWVETGGWRGEIHFDKADDWARWSRAYGDFVVSWAKLAESSGVELLSVGVELRSWVTTTWAPTFSPVIQAVRAVYSGPLTYAANWDDAEHTVIWGDLDLIGINAFYPLTQNEKANLTRLLLGGQTVAKRVASLAKDWNKPVLFTEVGYTNRPAPAVRPWEWPEDLGEVATAPDDQADAYQALLAGFLDQPWFAGFFVWRMYADTYDMSQEPAWGFSPLHQPAELVLRDAFSTPWRSSGGGQVRLPGDRAERIGNY